MADAEYTSVYRQFFEEFARTVKPEDPLPIGVPPYNVDSSEMMGEMIESCIQYLTINKCPQCLIVPILNMAIEEMKNELNKQNKSEYEPLKVMQMCTSKINDICLRYTDNEKVSNLAPPVSETYFSHHGIKHVRRRMEDRLICLPRFHSLYNIQNAPEAGYYALFDGHNGSTAATYAVSHLHQFLAESPLYPQDPISALQEAYIKTDSQCIAKQLRGGTTALVVLHLPESRKLIVSWLGDSQAMLVRQDGYMLLADPHKPGRRDETERISNLGGVVSLVNGSYRVNGQIAVSRAIGDAQFKPLVSADPDIREIELNDCEEFIVIGCDGLWDVVEPHEVIEAVYMQMKENPNNLELVSRRLVDLAKKNNSTDNISVIVVFLADPIDIGKRSVEAIGPRPRNLSQEEMDTNFHTASEKSPFVAVSDQGMNRIYEENGRNTDYMDYADRKDDSDEDVGPETDVDAIDDIPLPPSKCKNPFANDVWKKGGDDCDAAHDLIDYGKPEDLNMDRDVVNFADNINKFLKDNSENESVEGLDVSEELDRAHMNQINSSYFTEMDTAISDSQNIKFSSCIPVNNEFIDDIKFDNDNEKSVKSDLKDHSTVTEEKDFVGVNDFSDFEKFQDNLQNDFGDVGQGERENRGTEEIMCNGSSETHTDNENPVSPVPAEDKLLFEDKADFADVEQIYDMKVTSQTNDIVADSAFGTFNKLDDENTVVSTTNLPDLTCEVAVPPAPDSTLNIPQVLSDSETASQQSIGAEKPEFLSPAIGSLDENLKDDIVTESGGEVDSEDDEWNYIKVGSGVPADEQIDSVALSPQVAETDKSMMNSPLNPHAAEFVPVTPVTNAAESDMQTTPPRAIPPHVNDIIASSPSWDTMDNVDTPDEASFLKEIKTRPSDIFLDNDPSSNDLEGLGCTEINFDGKVEEQVWNHGSFVAESPMSEKHMGEIEQQQPALVPESAPHGIDLASDMTSSFIDTSTMSTDTELSKHMFELNLHGKELEKPETFSTLNVDAAEFKSEMMGFASDLTNRLPDLLSPFSVTEDVVESKDITAAPVEVVPPMEEHLADFVEPISPIVENSTVPNIQIANPEEVVNPEVITPEKMETADVLGTESVQQVVESPLTPEPVAKTPEPTPVVEVAVASATAATIAGATAVAATVIDKKEELKKSPAPAKTAGTTPKVMKSTTTPRAPLSAGKAVPAAKKSTTPLASKTATSKPVNTTASSPSTAKPVAWKTTTTTRTVTARTVTSTAAPRPLARKTTTSTPTTPTAPKTTTITTTRPNVSRPTAPTKTAVAPRVTSTVTAPKPKPRVPSAPIDKKPATNTTVADALKRPEAKKPTPTSTTVTAMRRPLTSRPASAPLKSAVKTTTTTRMTTTKPRTSSSGVTTTTTTTTRTVLNSKKPLSVTSKDVGSKPLSSKTVASKVNGLANGKTTKTTVTSTAITKTKIENKTETKAEHIVDPCGDIIPNEIEKPVVDNNKDVNLINGIDHD